MVNKYFSAAWLHTGRRCFLCHCSICSSFIRFWEQYCSNNPKVSCTMTAHYSNHDHYHYHWSIRCRHCYVVVVPFTGLYNDCSWIRRTTDAVSRNICVALPTYSYYWMYFIRVTIHPRASLLHLSSRLSSGALFSAWSLGPYPVLKLSAISHYISAGQ